MALLFLAMAGFLAGSEQLSTVAYAEEPPVGMPETSNVGTIDPSQYAVALSSSGQITLHLETVPGTNVIRAGKDTVTTHITAPASSTSKLRLFISTDSTASNALTNGTDSITATSGTITSPTALTGNTWGYALANTTTGLPTNGFDTTYTTPDPGKTSKWAGVPTQGNEQLIQTLNMNQSATNTDVYLAVSATDSLTEGAYVGNIVYTAIYDAAETREATLDPTSGTKDDTVTMTLAAVAQDIEPGSVAVKMGEKDAVVTSVTKAANNLVQVTFTVPNMGIDGDYPVTATLAKTGDTYTSATNFAYTQPILPGSFEQAFQDAGKTKDPTTKLYKMQDMSTAICAAVYPPTSASSGDEQLTTLVDTRDGKTYRVVKLADNNCWMQENLRLGSTTDSYTLTAADSNVSSNYSLAAMSTGVAWTGSFKTPYFYSSDDQNTDPTKGALGYYGYYYNYHVASAGTDMGTSATELTSNICPKGWAMPSSYTVTPARSYANLLTIYGVIDSPTSSSYATEGYTKLISAPLKFVFSGSHFNPGKNIGGRGEFGTYWSDSSYNATNAYNLYFDSLAVDPQYNNDKGSGYVIRCLAK